jgi:hypothetical protein
MHTLCFAFLVLRGTFRTVAQCLQTGPILHIWLLCTFSTTQEGTISPMPSDHRRISPVMLSQELIMASTTILFGSTLVTLTVIVFVYMKKRSSLPLPPGPPALPIIGNAHQAPRSYPWLQYHDWAKTYGPVIYLNMLGQSLIILTTSQAAHDLLAKRGAKFSDRPRLVVSCGLSGKMLN